MNMVHSMDANPSRGSILHRADSKNRDEVLHPLGRLENAMSQQSVVTNSDTLTKKVNAYNKSDEARPIK